MRHLILPTFLALVCSLFNFAAKGQSPCGNTEIGQKDSQSLIQSKMNCFAAENARLRADLEKAKADLAAANESEKQVTSYIHTAVFDLKSFSLELCKSNAIDSVAKRGGVFQSQSKNWLHFAFGGDVVTVNCGYQSQGFIVWRGHTNPNRSDTVAAMIKEIFPEQ